MVWIVIIGIFIVAFGPLMWMLPSPRERRLAKLRQRAYERGMRVELRRLPKLELAAEERVSAGGRALDTTREYAAYLMPLDGRLKRLPSWRLLRHGDGSPAVPGWAFEAGRRPDHDDLAAAVDAVAPMLAGLPEDVIAVECESLTLAGYWLEGPDTTPDRVDDLADRLEAGGRALTELDARLRRAGDA